VDSKTGKALMTLGFSTEEMRYVRDRLENAGIYPIVYAIINGVEQFSYIERYVTPKMRDFLNKRKGDPRKRVVETVEELYVGQVFYFTCIDAESKLFSLKKVFKVDSRFNCIYSKDIYDLDSQWLELLPVKATKAFAALQVKQMLGCERLVVFGDNINDIPMFEVADECYAVANAVSELKTIATGIIGGNDEDGVAKWIERRAT